MHRRHFFVSRLQQENGTIEWSLENKGNTIGCNLKNKENTIEENDTMPSKNKRNRLFLCLIYAIRFCGSKS